MINKPKYDNTMVRTLKLVLVLVMGVFTSIAYSQTTPVKIDLSGNGNKLNANFYKASGLEKKPTLILLHGMPGGEGDLFGLGKKLSPLGINVLVFNFQGLWSSEGEFSFDSSMENIGSAIRFLKEEENLSRAGVQLKGFARTNLFKRLESSGYSFLLSVSRQLLRNFLFLYAIENNKSLPVGKQETAMVDDFLFSDTEVDKNDGDDKGDISVEILDSEEKYRDNAGKLSALIKLCNNNHPEEKILIFTQYSDTAEYINRNIKNTIAGFEYVTGGMKDPTSIAYRFSPVSNEKQSEINKSKEIRVLVSTDVLSEGQNLQDAHIVVNYDLPWAIIRLIQRAGRVDRIGQKSNKIYCYSFLPEDGIEDIINLRGRLQNRIRENAETIGADEVFFDGDPVNIKDLYNEKAGILDDDEDTEVDLASYAFQIWKNATDKNIKLKKIIPDLSDVLYSTKKADNGVSADGVVIYTKTAQENDILTFIDHDKKVITQSQFTILKTLKCEQNEPALTKSEDHHELVAEAVKHIKKIEDKIGGQLGKKSNARYRAYMRLSRYLEENKGTLFVTEELKRSVEDIYRYPLREYARETINRQLKMGISDEQLGTLVVSLRDENKLSIKDEKEIKHKEPKIICSMGIVKHE